MKPQDVNPEPQTDSDKKKQLLNEIENDNLDDDNIKNLLNLDILPELDESLEEQLSYMQILSMRLKKYMIPPGHRRLKLYHEIVSVAIFADIIISSYILGNYEFQLDPSKYENFMNYEEWYFFINAIEGIDIVLTFFKIQMVDGVIKFNDPLSVASQYFFPMFFIDILSIIPYNTNYPMLILLRFLKLPKLIQYERYLEDLIAEFVSSYLNSEKTKRLLRGLR